MLLVNVLGFYYQGRPGNLFLPAALPFPPHTQGANAQQNENL